MRRAIKAAVALTAVVVAVGGVSAAPSATAAARFAPSSSCHAKVEPKVQWPLEDEYRVVAWCDSLDSNMKARGVLDMHWAPDSHTDWFSDTGVMHYSDWHFAVFGEPSARVEHAQR